MRGMMRLRDKVAIVTGGGSGFGAGIVRKFISEGARVIVADRDAKAAERVASELGDAARPITVDVTVKVPLVGGKIADWAAKNDVQRSVEAEFTFGDQWLAAHAG